MRAAFAVFFLFLFSSELVTHALLVLLQGLLVISRYS